MILKVIIASLCLAQLSFAADTFYAANRKLYDANGKEFYIRGINNNHGNFDEHFKKYIE